MFEMVEQCPKFPHQLDSEEYGHQEDDAFVLNEKGKQLLVEYQSQKKMYLSPIVWHP
jgi:hypothetical protein